MIKKIRKITKHFNLISKLGQYKCREHEKGTFLKTVDVPFSFWSKTEKDRYDYSEELNPNNPTGACNVPAWANVDVQQISVPHQILVLKLDIRGFVSPPPPNPKKGCDSVHSQKRYHFVPS